MTFFSYYNAWILNSNTKISVLSHFENSCVLSYHEFDQISHCFVCNIKQPVRKFMAWHKRNSSQNRENWARKNSAKIRLTRAGKMNENGTRHLYRRDIGAPLWAVIWRDSGPIHGRKNPAGERDDNSGFNGSSSSISLYITSTTNNNFKIHVLGLFCNLCTR